MYLVQKLYVLYIRYKKPTNSTTSTTTGQMNGQIYPQTDSRQTDNTSRQENEHNSTTSDKTNAKS